MPQRDNDIKLR